MLVGRAGLADQIYLGNVMHATTIAIKPSTLLSVFMVAIVIAYYST